MTPEYAYVYAIRSEAPFTRDLFCFTISVRAGGGELKLTLATIIIYSFSDFRIFRLFRVLSKLKSSLVDKHLAVTTMAAKNGIGLEELAVRRRSMSTWRLATRR